MQALPNTLAQKIQSKILFHHEVKTITHQSKGFLLNLESQSIYADLVISSSCFPFFQFAQKKTSLTLVHLLTKETLPYKGFGFLTKKSSLPLLGATFDSHTFLDTPYTKLCFFLQGEIPSEQALSIVEKSAKDLIKIQRPFLEFFVTYAKNAVAQYPVHHNQRVEEIEKSLPKGFFLIGAELYGIGVNTCIDHADLLSDALLKQLQK